MSDPGQELATLDFGSLIGGPLVAVITAQSMAARATADFIKTVGFDEDNKPIYVDFTYPKETVPYQPAQPGQLNVKITAAGSGYVSAPGVTFAPALPAGASAVVTVAPDGTVASIKVTGLDASFTNPPTTVTIDGPGGGGVTAAATVTGTAGAAPVLPVYTQMQISVPILTMLPIPFIKIDSATVDFNAKITSVETRQESSDLAISGNLEVKQRWPGGAAKLNVSCSYQKKSATGSSVERTYSMAVHVAASQDEMPAGMEKLLSILEGAMKSVPVLNA